MRVAMRDRDATRLNTWRHVRDGHVVVLAVDAPTIVGPGNSGLLHVAGILVSDVVHSADFLVESWTGAVVSRL